MLLVEYKLSIDKNVNFIKSRRIVQTLLMEVTYFYLKIHRTY